MKQTLTEKIKIILGKFYSNRMGMNETLDGIERAIRLALDDEFHEFKDLNKNEILDRLRRFLTAL